MISIIIVVVIVIAVFAYAVRNKTEGTTVVNVRADTHEHLNRQKQIIVDNLLKIKQAMQQNYCVPSVKQQVIAELKQQLIDIYAQGRHCPSDERIKSMISSGAIDNEPFEEQLGMITEAMINIVMAYRDYLCVDDKLNMDNVEKITSRIYDKLCSMSDKQFKHLANVHADIVISPLKNE